MSEKHQSTSSMSLNVYSTSITQSESHSTTNDKSKHQLSSDTNLNVHSTTIDNPKHLLISSINLNGHSSSVDQFESRSTINGNSKYQSSTDTLQILNLTLTEKSEFCSTLENDKNIDQHLRLSLTVLLNEQIDEMAIQHHGAIHRLTLI
jgi:hypothetical protein